MKQLHIRVFVLAIVSMVNAGIQIVVSCQLGVSCRLSVVSCQQEENGTWNGMVSRRDRDWHRLLVVSVCEASRLTSFSAAAPPEASRDGLPTAYLRPLAILTIARTNTRICSCFMPSELRRCLRKCQYQYQCQ
jgi:hypothetical protein